MFDKRAITVKFKTDIKDLAAGFRQASNGVKSFVSEAKSALQQLAKDSEGVRGAIGGIAKSLGGAAGAAFDFAKALSVGVAGAMTGLAAYGLKMGNSIQQTAIAFDTMLGSADARRGLMKDITDFAKNTPFERFDLIDSSKTLLAMGVSADKIIPTMKALGDVSAGVSTNVKEVAFVFGQVKAQGQAYTADLNQFAARGIPIYEELAKVLKVSVSTLREGMGKGDIKVGFNDVEKAFQNMTKEGGKFYNLMDLQSKSLGGIVSNLKDGFDNLVLTFMGITSEGDIKSGSFFDMAQQKASAFQQWLAANEANIGKWGERTFTEIANGINWAWTDMISPSLQDFQNWFNTGGKESIKTFVTEGWRLIVDGFNYFRINILPYVIEGMKALGDFLKSEDFKNGVKTAADLFRGLADIIRNVNSGFDDLTRKAQIATTAAQAVVWGAGQGGQDNRQGFVDGFANTLRSIGIGRRANGGPVKGGEIYQVGEYNRPELLDIKGKQYLIPGDNGQVFNQNQIPSQTNTHKSINIYQYGSNLETTFTSSPLLAI